MLSDSLVLHNLKQNNTILEFSTTPLEECNFEVYIILINWKRT
jgi:hypothetical protein